MPHPSPQTLTMAEQRAILLATARNLRDHLVYSLAFGTGLRLAEIVGLNVGDVFFAERHAPFPWSPAARPAEPLDGAGPVGVFRCKRAASPFLIEWFSDVRRGVAVPAHPGGRAYDILAQTLRCLPD